MLRWGAKMKNKALLEKGKTFQIKYIGPSGYDSYDGEGVFNGETDDIDGEVFGFRIDGMNYVAYFPLDSIFTLE